MKESNFFEQHPKKTLIFIILFLLAGLYGLASVKIFNNAYTEYESKSLKTILHQYYVGKIIDNNIGRFIKLREYSPNQIRYERPTKNYLKNIVPGSVERKYYRISTDKHGFIGPSEVHTSPDIKIVFLGGSTTECLYMEESERFPYLVGRELEKRLNKKVNSYNGGVSANDSLHSLNILLNKVIPMQPNMVVMMHNINDVVVLRSQGTYWYERSLKSHIQTAQNVFTRYELPSKLHQTTEAEMITAFKKNLKTFITICRLHDIQPVLMTQANRVKDDLLYHQFNEIIRESAREARVQLIDLADAIPPTQVYLYDSYHYTAEGSKLAANIIASQLKIGLTS